MWTICLFFIANAAFVMGKPVETSEFVRNQATPMVEVIITSFSNGNGILWNGKLCDKITTCDPILYGELDLKNPRNRTNGFIKPHQQFKNNAALFHIRNTRVTNVNVMVTETFDCNSDMYPMVANLRVLAMDKDSIPYGQQELMDVFDCIFIIEKDWKSHTNWSKTKECRGFYQPKTTRLFYKWRINVENMPTSGCAIESSSFDGIDTVIPVTTKPDQTMDSGPDYELTYEVQPVIQRRS